jgi:hypothetical protein
MHGVQFRSKNDREKCCLVNLRTKADQIGQTKDRYENHENQLSRLSQTCHEVLREPD